MPNKNLLKILFFVVISAYCSSLAEPEAARATVFVDASMPSPAESPCAPWARDAVQFAVGYLCVVQVSPGDDRPLYVGTVESRIYKFLFSEEAIALALPRGEFEIKHQDAAWARQVLQDIPPDQLAIWYSEALYWWRWLKSTEVEWSGREDPA